MGVPLIVHEMGGQTRGFIHITDTAKCIKIAINNSPKAGDRVEIFNKIAEICFISNTLGMVAE